MSVVPLSLFLGVQSALRSRSLADVDSGEGISAQGTQMEHSSRCVLVVQ